MAQPAMTTYRIKVDGDYDTSWLVIISAPTADEAENTAMTDPYAIGAEIIGIIEA